MREDLLIQAIESDLLEKAGGDLFNVTRAQVESVLASYEGRQEISGRVRELILQTFNLARPVHGKTRKSFKGSLLPQDERQARQERRKRINESPRKRSKGRH